MEVVDRFARLVEEFEQWCSAAPTPGDDEVEQLMRCLARLYAGALDLPVDGGLDDDLEQSDEASDEAGAADDSLWRQTYDRCASLPVSYYAVVLDPLAVPAGETGLGDLADDVADIRRDLARGRAEYERGRRRSAAWEWRHGFDTHWGEHALGALTALRAWSRSC